MLRRTHRLGGLGAVTAAGPEGRRRGPKRPSPHRRAWKVRPHDLLVFDIELVNLKVVPSEDPDTAATIVKDGSGGSFLILVFPPQSLVEEAYYTTEADNAAPEPDFDDPDDPIVTDAAKESDEDPPPPPIPALLSGWSRLAFIVPDEQLPIDWTIPAVLDAIGGLELSVAPNALPPRNRPRRIRPWLDALVHPHAVEVQAAALAAASGVGSSGPLSESGAPSFVMARAGGGTLLAARDRRTIRTIGYTLGLTEVSGSATAGFVDELIQGELILPVELTRPVPRAPAPTQTALEVPYRLILSPNRFGAWFHARPSRRRPSARDTPSSGTRGSGVRHEDGTLIDGDDPLRTLRAVWALRPRRCPRGRRSGSPTHDTDPWRMSLDAFDRHNVMHLSSNFRLEDGNVDGRPYEPNPLDVRLLALSSLGAWMDTRGAWPYRAADRASRSRSGGTARRSDATTTSASSTPGSCTRSGTARR